MARGFESKDVEFQQAEAERGRTLKPPMTPAEREAQNRRRTRELALIKARADFEAARSEAHRRMLEAAVSALQAQLENE
jgi:hypothetical protein